MAKKSAKKAKSQSVAASKVQKTPKKALKKAAKNGAAAKKPTPAPPEVKPSTITAPERQAALSYFKKFKDSPASEREHAEQVLEKYRDEILAKRGVKSAEVGIKLSGPYQSRLYAICIYVEHKTKDHPSTDAAIPRGFRIINGQLVPEHYTESDLIPPDFDSVPTDVIEGKFSHFANRPQGGDFACILSTGGEIINKGTVACSVLGGSVVVLTPEGDERYLTCAHVLSASPPNSRPTFSDSVDVYTLNPSNGAVVKIGVMVHATSSPVQPADWIYNDVIDCALVTPVEGRRDMGISIRGVSQSEQPISARLTRIEDEANTVEVWMRGAVTQRKVSGQIASIRATPLLDDGTICSQQIRIRASVGQSFAVKGDSGGLVCIKSSAIGILRAASDDGSVAIASPLRTIDQKGIFDVLGVTFPSELD